MSRQAQTSSSYTSYSSTSYSSSSSSSGPDGQQNSGYRQMQSSYTDPSGATVTQQASQNLGEPIVQEERRFDAQGREMLPGAGGADTERRIEDVSDADRKYEEAIEDEYAKREGGA